MTADQLHQAAAALVAAASAQGHPQHVADASALSRVAAVFAGAPRSVADKMGPAAVVTPAGPVLEDHVHGRPAA